MQTGKRQGCFQLKRKEKEIKSRDKQKHSQGRHEQTAVTSSSVEDMPATIVCWPVKVKRKLKALEEIGNIELSKISNQSANCADAPKMKTITSDDELVIDTAKLELSQPSAILNERMLHQLSEFIPKAWLVGHTWTLSYSTSNHGYSLNSLYRRLHGLDTPTLLVIRDSNKHVFGAMLPCSLSKSNQFYGNGQSFLFTFYEQFKTFEGSGENWLFVKGNLDSIAIGASDGSYGLWLEQSLFRGRTQPCSTFNNLILTDKEDFQVGDIEVWSYVS